MRTEPLWDPDKRSVDRRGLAFLSNLMQFVIANPEIPGEFDCQLNYQEYEDAFTVRSYLLNSIED